MGDWTDPGHRAECVACAHAWWAAEHPHSAVFACVLVATAFIFLVLFVVSGL